MKYAFAVAALAGIAVAQPHIGHQRLHKKKAAMETVTDWTVVTVTDVVTVYGPSPVAEPTKAADPPAAPVSSAAAAPSQPAPSVAPPAPAAPSQQAPAASSASAPASAAPAQSPSDQPKAANLPAPSASPPAPAPAPAPAQSSPAPAGGNSGGDSSGGSSVGKYGLMPGASAPADCTADQPCKVGMTTYTTGMGACGYDDSAPNDQNVVALQQNMFGSQTNTGVGQPLNKLCNKKIQIKNPANGVTAVGVIRDRCVGCTGDGGIDLSPPLWAALNNNGPGDRLPVEWYFLD